MKYAMLIATLFLAALTDAHAQRANALHPDPIESCLQNPAVKGHVAVDFKTNPYYLRGDFDGDGKPDYAVAIKGKKTRRNGVLICTARRQVFVLGADNPLKPPFSNMPDDNFVAPHWQALTREETKALSGFTSTVPNPLPTPKGETIAMIWEDGISLIYWDGERFCWAGSSS
jgi:hypothetical protein